MHKLPNCRADDRSGLMPVIERESLSTEFRASARIVGQLNEGITESSTVSDQSYGLLVFQA
jgi:hypothetical protein